MKNAKAKGSEREHKTIRWLEKHGYSCTRSAASLGAFDIVAIHDLGVLLIQVKSNCWPSPAERQEMLAIPQPKHLLKLMIRWDDYKRKPLIRVLSAEYAPSNPKGDLIPGGVELGLVFC